jgi:hypothetical protein
VGYSRRKEAQEIVDTVKEADRKIQGVTLGQLCAANMAVLDVACFRCQRRGRYRLTRLIDRHGAGMGLVELKSILAASCPKLNSPAHFDICGAHFPCSKLWKPGQETGS